MAENQTQRSYTCSWCGAVSDGVSLSCPACGATVNVKDIVTQSGWVEAPGRKDMAKLQFGNSFCQIEGAYVPAADVNLSKEDTVYFAHHTLLWKDTQVTITNMPIKGAWKRVLAGMPVIMTQAHGPGHIAFSRDVPGEVVALPIQPGQSVDVREHVFVLASGQVNYGFFQPGIWFTTKKDDETENHYPVGYLMDRFSTTQKPGLVLLHASGNVFQRKLVAGQTVLVKPTALLYKDQTVQMQLHFEHPSGAAMFGGIPGLPNLGGLAKGLAAMASMSNALAGFGQRYIWLALYGPGRVAVQSAFEPIEGEAGYITSHSNATRSSW
jgi:uncharacterized protein (AIM24 family)